MKKLLLLVLFSLILAAGASALQVTSGTIGGESQDRVANASTSITVTNDGASNLSNVVMTFAGDTKYNIHFEPATFNLAAGAAQTVTVYGTIPLNFDAVIKTASSSDYLKESPYKIGAVKAAVGTTEAVADLNMRAVNQIEIKKVTITCGDTSDRMKDGDSVEGLSPDTACSVTIEVKNNFDDNDQDDQLIGDIDFDPIYIEVESTDSDFDLDEDDDIGSLAGDDTDSITFDFNIEDDTDEGKYPVVVRAYGTDDNGAFHGDLLTFKLEVERLKHDLQIKGASVKPSQIDSCKSVKVTADATVINLGRNDDDDIVVKAVIADLDLEKSKTGLELDQDDSEPVSFTFDIPAGTKPGVYSIELSTYFDIAGFSNSKRLDFVVNECAEVAAVTTVDATGATAITTAAADGTTVTTGATAADTTAQARVKTATSSFKESPAYLWLLGGIAVLLVIIVLGLLVVLFRRPLDEE
jgi:uncharacterized membrane protein